MNDIMMASEEIAMDGSIAVSGRSKSTLYRWQKAMNRYLKDNHFNWRVKASAKDMALTVEVVE